MTKKVLNQNAKSNQEFINTFEPDFAYNKTPINRFSDLNDINAKGITAKAKRLLELKNRINSIEKCNLKDNSKNLILGSGNVNSSIMFVGEAPSIEEDESGLIFQGKVGELLAKMLIAINIKIQNAYLAYSINFRPPDDRKPTAKEIRRYSTFLKEHISIIKPKILVLMGSTAMECVTGSKNKISNERGIWKELILDKITYPIMVTFSPSYLIRYPENKKYSWEDLKKIKQKIQELNTKI
tara:strand:+ start:478 stop:1197 length:720 start_codon:yes stop_codon:yes gene_type:complete